MHWLWNLRKGLSEKMLPSGGAEECLEQRRLYQLYGLYPFLPDDGDSSENAGEKSPCQIPEREYQPL